MLEPQEDKLKRFKTARTITGLFRSGASGAISGLVGGVFRGRSTSSMRNSALTTLQKGFRKLDNGISNSNANTMKRGFQYIDWGFKSLQKYAYRAGTNSGVGSGVGIVISQLWQG